ncbi:MAG: DegT/DnrJ/EryC1/StrS family aminotransferase [Dehalococcoidia bacterium]
MAIPLVDLVAQYEALKPELDNAILGALDGMQLYLGRNTRAFEDEFARYCGVRECIGVGSGTDALHIALRALGVGPGDEVVAPAHTFFATAEAVALTGATPAFVDVDPVTRCLNAETVAPAIGERTRAVIAVHMHGQVAEMAGLRDLTRRHGLALIEDAAQAHGAEYAGRRAGALADIACFSFYFSKNLGAYGEAGAITTNDAALAERLRIIRDHGSRERYRHELIGLNGRLDEIQAAVLRVKLPHLDAWNERRRLLARRYDDALQDTPIELPAAVEPSRHVYHHYAVLAPRRDELAACLREQGIGTGIHYPVPCHRQPAMTQEGAPHSPRQADVLRTAEHIAAHVLSLPMYPEMTEAQVEEVAAVVRAFYHASDTSGVVAGHAARRGA